MARHQEINNDVDRGTIIRRGNLADKLEASKLFSLLIAMPSQSIDEHGIFTVAKCLGIKTKINVEGAYMRHIFIVQQQPRDGAANHGELSSEAPQDLPDLDQHALDGARCAIVVVGCRLRFASS